MCALDWGYMVPAAYWNLSTYLKGAGILKVYWNVLELKPRYWKFGSAIATVAKCDMIIVMTHEH